MQEGKQELTLINVQARDILESFDDDLEVLKENQRVLLTKKFSKIKEMQNIFKTFQKHINETT